jgi:hypothetical protein
MPAPVAPPPTTSVVVFVVTNQYHDPTHFNSLAIPDSGSTSVARRVSVVACARSGSTRVVRGDE